MSSISQKGRATTKALMCCALVVLLVAMAGAQSSRRSRGIPGAPAGVVAVPLRDAAIVAWVLPEMAPDAPAITSYTITALDSEPLRVAATVRAHAPGAVVRGLSGRHCYTFSVHASNAAGNGPESQPSEVVCPLPPPGADIALTMEAPDFGTAGADLTFTMTVTNKGVGDAGMVTLVDTLPAPLSSYNSTQGVCVGVPGSTNFTCNLGAIDSGSSATVMLTVRPGGTQITNTAWATGYDAMGAALADPVPANNMATATVRIE